MAVILENTTTKTLLEDELSRKADFRVGVVATEKVVPNLNISFDCASGAEKYFINLNRRGVTVGDEKETYLSDKLSLEVGNTTDVWYLDAEGNFKWDIEYAIDPRPLPGADHVEEWALTNSQELRFHYQDTLEADWNKLQKNGKLFGKTLAEFLADGNRPDKVVGSYAVYGDKKHHARRADGTTIANYATGKVAHIYRPLCIDADGKKAWGVLNISGSELSITIPASFLDTAAFPVTLDPTIGYTTAGGTNQTSDDYYLFSRFSAPASGDANPGTLYAYGEKFGGGTDGTGGAYADNAGTAASQSKLSSSDAALTWTTTLGWHSAAITWTGIVASTDYWVGTYNDRIYYYYDTTGTGGYEDFEYYQVAWTDGTLDDPFGSPSSVGFELSVYLDYTTSGGGGIEILRRRIEGY